MLLTRLRHTANFDVVTIIYQQIQLTTKTNIQTNLDRPVLTDRSPPKRKLKMQLGKF